MSTRIQQSPFASSFVNHSELVAVGPGHRLRINVTPSQRTPELDCYQGLKRIIDPPLPVHPGPKLFFFTPTPVPPCSFCAPVPSHFSCICVTPQPRCCPLQSVPTLTLPSAGNLSNLLFYSIYIYIKKQVVCICIYTCLSYYEYYNKTNTSLSMPWPFLPTRRTGALVMQHQSPPALFQTSVVCLGCLVQEPQKEV